MQALTLPAALLLHKMYADTLTRNSNTNQPHAHTNVKCTTRTRAERNKYAQADMLFLDVCTATRTPNCATTASYSCAFGEYQRHLHLTDIA